MNTRTHVAVLLVSVATVFAPAASAADAAAPVPSLTGEITPKLYGFDYFDGVGSDRASFLERYRPQNGWSGDRRSGLYPDLDFNVKFQPDEKRSLSAKRWGEGQYRHGGNAAWDTERLRVLADYTYFRRYTGGIDYLFSPNLVPGGTDPGYYPTGSTNSNSGYLAQFNDDSNRTLYQTSRFAYGLGFMIKPGVLGEKTTVTLNYMGYLRYGQRRSTFALGGSDVRKEPIPPTTSFVLQRWRGFSQNVDENMNRFVWGLTASPRDAFNLTYIGAVEKFDNRARQYTHRDLPLVAPYFYNPTADSTRPLGFTPDSTLLTHALRLGKDWAGTRLGAGYGNSKLDQDSFTQPQIRLGYTTGRIQTENAFVELDSVITPLATLQGFVRFGQRDNDSTYPVADLISGLPGAGETLGVRINRIESVSYGLAAALRTPGIGSTVTLGWKAEDKRRDLTYHASGITPSVSLYRGDTETNEVYAKWSALNVKGATLRLTSSYAWADRTGLVTEPSQALGIRAAASYTAASGLLVSGYYSVKDRENDNNSWNDKAVPSPGRYVQDISSTVQSAGASLHFQPARDANAYIGLDWMRMDASVLFYESSRRRFESTTTFNLKDLVGSLIDNYLLSVGGDYKAGEGLNFTGSYNLTQSDGNLASGYVARELSAIDDTLDNILHTIELGANYDLSKSRQLRIGYRYDNYEDSAYPLLSAGVHSVMVALRLKL